MNSAPSVRRRRGAYTNLALLLSDQCPTTIKLAFLAENEHRVDEVVELSGSLFRQYADTFEKLDRHNRKFIKTLAGRAVDDKEYREYPVMSIREALANAVVHRDYSLSTPTLVRVSHDRIEIVSTGGLAPGVSKEELFLGVSVCRNPKLARVFNKIRVVDSFGLGLARIREGYQNTAVEPSFEIGSNFFKITLFNTFERRSKPRTKEEQPDELRIAKLDPVELSVAPSVDELTNATNAEAPNYDGSLSVASKNLTSPNATVRRKQLEGSVVILDASNVERGLGVHFVINRALSSIQRFNRRHIGVVEQKSKTLKFSSIRALRTVFGMAEKPLYQPAEHDLTSRLAIFRANLFKDRHIEDVVVPFGKRSPRLTRNTVLRHERPLPTAGQTFVSI